MDIHKRLVRIQSIGSSIAYYRDSHKENCPPDEDGEEIPIFKCTCSSAKNWIELQHESANLRKEIKDYIEKLKEERVSYSLH